MSRKIINLDKGVYLGLINDNKFKSNLITVYLARNLKREEVTGISLLSGLMSDGCGNYPTIRDISLKLDNLYGMSFDCSSFKHGEKLLMYFKFLSISDKYLDDDILPDVLDFVRDMILDPIVTDGKLNPEMLEVEKENLRDDINAKINDKRSYSVIRCIEIMCEDEPYSIDPVGYVEDLENIDAEDVYDIYRKVISTSNIFISIEGDFDEKEIEKLCRERFKFERGDVEEIVRESFEIESGDIKYVNEEFGANQGKLVIGIRTGVDYMDFERYYALMVANSILGGGPHSKLFNNIREKESICYYSSSNIEKTKGIMIISSGIEIESYERALDLIRYEFRQVKDGNISMTELENAKKSIINALKSSYDSISGESSFIYNQFLSRTDLEIDKVISYIEDTDIEKIKDALKDAVEDTVYYLT